MDNPLYKVTRARRLTSSTLFKMPKIEQMAYIESCEYESEAILIENRNNEVVALYLNGARYVPAGKNCEFCNAPLWTANG